MLTITCHRSLTSVCSPHRISRDSLPLRGSSKFLPATQLWLTLPCMGCKSPQTQRQVGHPKRVSELPFPSWSPEETDFCAEGTAEVAMKPHMYSALRTTPDSQGRGSHRRLAEDRHCTLKVPGYIAGQLALVTPQDGITRQADCWSCNYFPMLSQWFCLIWWLLVAVQAQVSFFFFPFELKAGFMLSIEWHSE